MKNSNPAMLWFVAAFCFYLSTIIKFFSTGAFDVLFFCLGSATLCLGSSEILKAKKKSEEKKEETTTENTGEAEE